MLSVAAQTRLLSLLDEIARGEKQIERHRQDLANNSDFSPYSAFRLLDSFQDDYLTSRNLQTFLRDKGIDISSLEAYDLIHSFAKYPSHRLSYADFRSAVLPSDNEILRELAETRRSVSPYIRLPYRVESELADLFRDEVMLQREVRILRENLRSCPDFEAHSAFRSIGGNDRYIYPEDIRDLYRRAGRTLLPSEEDAIMRRLDQDADGKLSFNEFYDAVSISKPDLKSPESSYAYRRSSPSPTRRSYSTYTSPFTARSFLETYPYRRYYYWPYYRRYYYYPSYERSYYYTRPLRSTLDDSYTSLSPARRSLYEASPPRYSPTRSTLQTTGRGSGLTQPKEYSPLGRFEAVKGTPSKSAGSTRPYVEEVKHTSSPSRFEKSYERSRPSRFETPLQQPRENRFSSPGAGISQPYNYSPLRDFQVVREHPDKAGGYSGGSFSYYRPKEEERKQEQEEPQQDQTKEPMLIEENRQNQEEGEDEREEEGQEGQEEEDEAEQPEEKGQEEQQEDEEEQKEEDESPEMEGQEEEIDKAEEGPEEEKLAETPEKMERPHYAGGYYLETPPRAAAPGFSSYSRISPQKSEMEANLACKLRNQMSEDIQVEFLKEELALKADFNLEDAFAYFDLGRRGRISQYDLKDVLNYLGIYPTLEDCLVLIQKFDVNHDAVLDFSEFQRVFLPNDPVTAGQLQARASHNLDSFYSRQDIFTPRTETMMADVLRSHMNSERAAEHIRQRLRLEGSTIREAFEALDKAGKGHISSEDMNAVLDENRLNVSRNELKSFMDRFDKDKDGKVTYDEFVEEMIPKSPARIY